MSDTEKRIRELLKDLSGLLVYIASPIGGGYSIPMEYVDKIMEARELLKQPAEKIAFEFKSSITGEEVMRYVTLAHGLDPAKEYLVRVIEKVKA